MANTWTAAAQSIAYAANKHMIDLFNGSGSARYIRIFRIYFFNNGTSSVTGALTTLSIIRSSSASGGTTVTPVPHATSNSALDANSSAGTGRTVTASGTFRRLLYQNDEPTVTTLDMDALLTTVPYAEIWNAGYGDASVEPITCRPGQNEGLTVRNGAVAVGSADAEIQFTDAAS